MAKDPELFLKDLSYSHKRVNEFAYRFFSKGKSIYVAPHPPVGKYATDECDMFGTFKIEHKVRSLNFTCREDYPFKTVFVDEVYKIDNKQHLPLCYVIENKEGTHCASVFYWTKPKWIIETKYDDAQNRICDFYAVPKEMVRFCPIDEVF